MLVIRHLHLLLHTSIIVFMRTQYRKEFISSLLQLQTNEEAESFLKGLLTPQELEELPKRLAIFQMLHQGVPQHAIAKKLHVGVATVTRGSLELKREQIQKTSWWQNLSSHMGG